MTLAVLQTTGATAAPAPFADQFKAYSAPTPLTPDARAAAIRRLVPQYRGIPAIPFALGPQHPVVANIAALNVNGAEVVTYDYTKPAATGWMLDEYDDRSPRSTLSILLAPHAKAYVFDCKLKGSEAQVGYLVTDFVYDNDYDTKKSTTAMTGGHVLISIPPATKQQTLLIGRLFGPNPAHNPTFLFFTGCEITRLD
ncbi:hypothetical protein [Polymorphobacter megasporae]|uniref:hypothetical protein n=1 Tax=Glacieibacterium megasporae TaxID=2835787 RepID=UPI001C1E6C1E|nr:hypothetical protein [Polymorphobacter megasporae]UAJ09904.1 hypothetical protein KTC28_16680 [Polymorphobacter megasporae]